jgi:hypothetical protein
LDLGLLFRSERIGKIVIFPPPAPTIGNHGAGDPLKQCCGVLCVARVPLSTIDIKTRAFSLESNLLIAGQSESLKVFVKSSFCHG